MINSANKQYSILYEIYFQAYPPESILQTQTNSDVNLCDQYSLSMTLGCMLSQTYWYAL